MGIALGAVMYDPATLDDPLIDLGAGAAMTAIDTTNLRLTFIAPPSGRVRAIFSGMIEEPLAAPAFLLGVLDGSTVKLRVATHIRHRQMVDAEGIVTGLTPGTSYTWDAACGIEATGTRDVIAGGPNNATELDAAGGFLFVIEEA
jgi:hypothetical protein